MPINQWFDTTVTRFGEKPAIFTGDGQSISFTRLSEATDQIAAALKGAGARPDDNILSTVDHLGLNIAFWFAVWRLGANVLANKSAANFTRAGLSVDMLLNGQPGLDHPARKVLDFTPEMLSAKVAKSPAHPAGKTLFPTVNATRSLGILAATARQVIDDANRYVALLGKAGAPIFMTTSLDSMRAFRDVFRAFANGQPVIGPDMPPEAYWPKIIEHRVGELFVTPLMLHRLIHDKNRPADTSFIRRIFVGSGTPQKRLLKEATDIFGPVIDLAAGTPESSIYAYKKLDISQHNHGHIGPAVNGLTAEVLGSDGAPLGPNTVGRLRLNIPPAQQLEGYLGGPEAYDSDGWFYPGFLATIDKSGEMVKHGRTDDRLSFGGVRYFSGLIEKAVETLPTVRKACAIRVFTGEGAEALGIVAIAADGFSSRAVREMAKRSLSGIAEVLVKECADLPLLSDGSPDRAAVEKRWHTLP